jgi:uncharacterized protein YihD (DUF1040 family)
MRDPTRIDRILDLLRIYWIDNPDMRLGQIVVNACECESTGELETLFHTFWVEDDVAENGLRKLLRRK